MDSLGLSHWPQVISRYIGPMLRVVSEFLDRCAIRSACCSVRVGPREEARMAEAEALLERPDFFEVPHAPVEPMFTGRVQFQFASPLNTPWPENNVVHGKLYRQGREWTHHPTMILLHGWNGEYGYRFQFPWLARRLGRAGFNAAMIELPYHAQRRPRAPGAIRNFISHDLYTMVEATRQAIADIRALTAWLHGQGSPLVGLWGISLAAWLTSLLATCEPRVRLAVLMSPVVRLDRAIAELPFCEPIRHSLNGRPLPWERLDPASYSPLSGPENILLLESSYDLFASPESLERLWKAWGRPERWPLPHGHISVMASLPVTVRTVEWLRQRAAALQPAK